MRRWRDSFGIGRVADQPAVRDLSVKIGCSDVLPLLFSYRFVALKSFSLIFESKQ
jgi:hypothetical protein